MLKVGKTLGGRTALAQRVVWSSRALSTSTSLRRRLPLNKTETAAGGPWNNCRPFNAKLAPDATLMGGT